MPCSQPTDLEWKLIYVSSPGNEELDQELDDCLVGPVPVGVNSFEFEGLAPDPSKIPTEDVLGVAALILTGSYRDQEFVRVGYYQNTEYDNEEMKAAPPDKIQFDRLVRDISTKLRVTRFQIKWSVLTATHIFNSLLICSKGRCSPITRSPCRRRGCFGCCPLCKRPG
jgi:histone chaperone ASF1